MSSSSGHEVRSVLVHRDARRTIVWVVHLDQHVDLVACLSWQRGVQHLHCLRLLGLQLNSVGARKYTGEKRGLNTLVESSQLVLVRSVSSLEQNGISVVFTCSDDYDPSRQPRPLLQSSRVSLLAERTRSGTFGEQANWRVTVEGESSLNKLARVFPSQNTTVQES